jgi:hypothetical protein
MLFAAVPLQDFSSAMRTADSLKLWSWSGAVRSRRGSRLQKLQASHHVTNLEMTGILLARRHVAPRPAHWLAAETQTMQISFSARMSAAWSCAWENSRSVMQAIGSWPAALYDDATEHLLRS